jgi:hypothetical protein
MDALQKIIGFTICFTVLFMEVQAFQLFESTYNLMENAGKAFESMFVSVSAVLFMPAEAENTEHFSQVSTCRWVDFLRAIGGELHV